MVVLEFILDNKGKEESELVGLEFFFVDEWRKEWEYSSIRIFCLLYFCEGWFYVGYGDCDE